MLSFARDLCPRHSAPLVPSWPKGAIEALLLLLDAFVRDERVQRMAGLNPVAEVLADMTRLPALVAECAPLCCFLGDELATELVAEALAGEGPRLDELRRRGVAPRSGPRPGRTPGAHPDDTRPRDGLS